MTQQFHFWVYTQRIKQKLSRYLYTSVHSSITHNNQKVETTQVSIDGRMNNETVLYTYNVILIKLKEKGYPCYNMDEP